MQLHVTKKAEDAIVESLRGQMLSGLRLGIRGGGCSGLSYVLELSDERQGDNVIMLETCRVYVDPKSALFLEGCTLDYVRGLMETGFKVLNPRSSKACGCGESFSI